MVRVIDPVKDYEVQNARITFIGIIIREEFKLRQQCHFIFISRRVATTKESEL
jgi:hypothetical protein